MVTDSKEKIQNKAFQIPNFQGEIYSGETIRTLYATDASVYRELPRAVIYPRSSQDVGEAVKWAYQNRVPLIPRGGGTSLAGQVVGDGVVMDVSVYLNQILEVDEKNRRVRVQPGMVRNQLNAYLKSYGLFFAPVTSTASRANIGGMIGNNSCGSNSMKYGSVREHLVSVSGYLSDGSAVTFKTISGKELSDILDSRKSEEQCLEKEIYHSLYSMIDDPKNQEAIRTHYPATQVTRRNTGYALDSLLEDITSLADVGKGVNLSKLIAGSEGTLMVVTEAVLQLEPLPPPYHAVVCFHCNSVREALLINVMALHHEPAASELIDDFILQSTKNHITHQKNRNFVVGDPKALLAVEFYATTKEELDNKVSGLKDEVKKQGYDISAPILFKEDIQKLWDLRAAGLGLLSSQPGDSKPYAVVEDAAVDPRDLPEFIADYDREMDALGLESIYYAHAGSGEIHLRPIFNLKTEQGKKLFRQSAEAMVRLVKKYRGSLSGEHGDGRLRGEFIPQVLGDEIYLLLREVKKIFDPVGVLNPGKIVDAPPMDTHHRYFPGQETRAMDTVLDFSHEQGIIRAAEMCNGSAECRKGVEGGGTMCPSYMALKREGETTRARANILREVLTRGPAKYRHGNPQTDKPLSDREYFDSEEVMEVMQHCLSCKGCKAECPSNVDVAKLKSEFLQQYYFTHRVPLSTQMIAGLPKILEIVRKIPAGVRLYNQTVGSYFLGSILKKILKFSPRRSLPKMAPLSLKEEMKRADRKVGGAASVEPIKTVYFFADEFTNHQEVEVGKSAIQLLQKLGYRVLIPNHVESGRTAISKGLLVQARKAVKRNLQELSHLISPDTPLIGVEPSALLTLRDEGIALLRGEEQSRMRSLAKNTFLIEEFLVQEINRGAIDHSQFTEDAKRVVCHVHCHQKALSDLSMVKKILSLPKNYQVEVIPSGCCGMAGSFGYEQSNYNLSMAIGELSLFPHIRLCHEEVLLVATGISCREQIYHGTGRQACHPVQVLERALK